MSALTSARRPARPAFILILGVLVAAIVFYGFSHTVDRALVHYKAPPPPILYAHVLLSSAWLILFIVQSAIARSGDVRLHRRLGLWGLGLGTAVALVGLATAIILRKRDIALHPGDVGAVAFLSIPLNSFASFAIPFFLAALWRKRPTLHRPLMVLATCSLTGAAMARIPWMRGPWIMAIIISLMIAAAVQDGLRTRRPSPAYLVGIPAIVGMAIVSLYLAQAAPPAWVSLAGLVLR